MTSSGVTNHMTDNSNIFFSFRSHKSHSPITIADELTYKIVGFRTIKPISSIILSSVLSLFKLTFNLIFVSKFTKDLNC